MNTNIVAILEENAREFPGKTAIVHGKNRITYGELLRNVRRRAAGISAKGIGKGDGVLIVVPMSIPLYEILIALFHVGAVAVFVDAWGNRERLEMAGKVFPMKAFVGVGAAHLIRLISPALRAIPIKLGAKLPRSWKKEQAVHTEVMADDPALITFTTGSTGTPRGANRTHGFLLSQYHALRNHLSPRPEDIDMPTLPIFPLCNLAVGSTTVLPDINFSHMAEFPPHKVTRNIIDNNVSTASGSPAFFMRLGKHLTEKKIAVPTLECVFVGGAPIFPRTARELIEAFPNTSVHIVYGSTEAEPVSGIPAEELLQLPETSGDTGLCVGYPVEDIRIHILPIDKQVEESTSPVKGEICVAGQHVLKNYAGDPAEQEGKFIEQDGERWLRTGDAGYLDEHGRLYLLGRVKNSWKEEGKRMFTMPVELALNDVKGVETGTVFRANDETIIAVQSRVDEFKISGRVAGKLNERGLPYTKIVILKSIPRDPRHASKIDYEQLRTQILLHPEAPESRTI